MNKRALRSRIVRLLILLSVFVWGANDALKGDWFLLQCLAAGIVLGLTVLIVAFPVRLKQALVAAFSMSNHRSAHPNEFPLLNQIELERLTREWELLGFVQCGDKTVGEATPKLGTAFSRLFEHEREGALVELSQQFLPTKTLPLSSSIVSFWDESEREQVQLQARAIEQDVNVSAPLATPDGAPPATQAIPPHDLKIWTLVTHNRPPSRFSSLLRHPRILGVRLETKSTPAQLWQAHQERSALIEAGLNMDALHGELLTLLYEHALVLSALNARRIRAISLWKIARLQFSLKTPDPIFDGELAPLIP